MAGRATLPEPRLRATRPEARLRATLPEPLACADAAAPPWRPIALTIAFSLFLLNLDSVILTTSLPAVAASFGRSAVGLTISITVYILAGAAIMPLSGWLSDRIGARRLISLGLLLFMLASAGCASARSFWPFILARTLQGAGGLILVPTGQAVVLRCTEDSRLVDALSLVTWPALIAPVLGPALGGFITATIGWRWNFWLNLPFGLAALGLTRWFVPELRHQVRRALDWLGFILTACAMIAVLAGLDFLARPGLAPAGLALAALGGVLGGQTLRHLSHHPAPLLRLHALAVPSFHHAVLWPGLLFRASFNATPYLLPLMFELAFGRGPAAAGLLVLVYFAGNLVTKSITTASMRRFGLRRLLIGNGVLAAFSLAGCAALSLALPPPWTLLLLFTAGATRSMQFSALTTLSFVGIAPAEKSDASTLSSLLWQASAAGGIGLAALALQLLGVHAGTPGAAHAFGIVFLGLALATALATIGFVPLPAATGAHVTRS